ncbi:MAG TPA: right-handed parallel beta-helix repeat-containing protein, partial [Verrucomicrobiae bacterium]|nr:right-handed parallel beta-helix repeat-containing protein [Verrucomicrobiae bacterium]
MKTRLTLMTFLGALAALISSASRAAGPLTPPGPPGPIYKTLQEVEPRTPISSLPFTISQPGSYYLLTNLTGVAGQHGITINGPRVTLDLMGFELRGVPGSLSGIHMNPATSPHIRNGSIAGWGQDGINGTNGGAGIIEELRVFNNARHGISFNSGSQIRKCVVGANGDVGIVTSNDVEIDDCVSNGNGTHGIVAGTGSNIRRCLAVQNNGTGITGSGVDGLNIMECNTEYNRASGIATIGRTMVLNCVSRFNTNSGISVGPASTVSGCNLNDNGEHGIAAGHGSTISGNTSSSNRIDGIQTGFGSTIIGNACRGNFGDGIEIAGDCNVVNNSCDNNGLFVPSLGANIHVRTDPSGPGDNRIEGNTCTDGDIGLFIEVANNIVANNVVRGNGTNYSIVPGNQLNILLCQIPQHVPWPATIRLAGSLTGIRNTNGITITSDDVTIDLNDHAIIGVPFALDGIRVEGTHTNITVRNGSIRSWPGDGVDASAAVNSQLRNLSSARNSGVGLRLGEGGLISGCTARTNTSDGIVASSGCRVVDCSASRNGSEGLIVGSGSTIEGCAAFENNNSGIIASLGSSIVNCTAYSNGTNGIAVLNSIFPVNPNSSQISG